MAKRMAQSEFADESIGAPEHGPWAVGKMWLGVPICRRVDEGTKMVLGGGKNRIAGCWYVGESMKRTKICGGVRARMASCSSLPMSR